MANVRLWAPLSTSRRAILFAALLFGMFAALPAGAQSNSQDLHEWQEMNANSFPPSLEVAKEQCRRAQLSGVECDEYALKLEAGEFTQVMVPDGTIYSNMNFSQGGEPHLGGSTVKQLGEETPALRVTLSTGRTLDWYAGFPGACNNVGIDPREPVLPPRKPRPEPKGDAVWVPFSDPVGSSTYQHLPGYVQKTCPCGGSQYIPGYTIRIPNTLKSHGGYWQSR